MKKKYQDCSKAFALAQSLGILDETLKRQIRRFKKPEMQENIVWIVNAQRKGYKL